MERHSLGRGGNSDVIGRMSHWGISLLDKFGCSIYRVLEEASFVGKRDGFWSYSSALSGFSSLKTYISKACLCWPILLSTIARAS